jgi:hypothetical protein
VSKTSCAPIAAGTQPGNRANIDQAFDTPGAAKYTGLSASNLNKRRLDGSGPVFLGARVVYLESDLRAWLDKNSRHSTSDEGGARA